MVLCFLFNVKMNYLYKYVKGKKVLLGVNYFSILKVLVVFINIFLFLKFVILLKK